jgi:hypothetical protein
MVRLNKHLKVFWDIPEEDQVIKVIVINQVTKMLCLASHNRLPTVALYALKVWVHHLTALKG